MFHAVCSRPLTIALFAVAGCTVGDGSGEAFEPGDPAFASASAACEPESARGAVPALAKAMLDMIASAEGTLGRGKDGYDVTFAYRFYAEHCDDHPFREREPTCAGSYCSTASGRYQFLLSTWDGLELPNFWPAQQERGALALIARRGVTLPEDRALTDGEFAAAMDKLSYEWASLPPGRYGQPTYTLAEARAEYCRHAACEP